MKEMKTQNLWSFELETQEEMNILVWIFVGFQQRDKQDSQNLNNDSFIRPPVTSAQGVIGTEKHPDSGILLNYDDVVYSQGYGQTEEAFRALTESDILQPYISENDFRSSNNDDDIGYNLYVFDKQYQINLGSAQPIQVEYIYFQKTHLLAYMVML